MSQKYFNPAGLMALGSWAFQPELEFWQNGPPLTDRENEEVREWLASLPRGEDVPRSNTRWEDL